MALTEMEVDRLGRNRVLENVNSVRLSQLQTGDQISVWVGGGRLPYEFFVVGRKLNFRGPAAGLDCVSGVKLEGSEFRKGRMIRITFKHGTHEDIGPIERIAVLRE